jgi:hypothetical protein
MGAHLINGQFQSDKYPSCPPGKVPLSVKDPTAQDLLWEYAQRRRVVDAEFADDLEWALLEAGYKHHDFVRVSVADAEYLRGEPSPMKVLVPISIEDDPPESEE